VAAGWSCQTEVVKYQQCTLAKCSPGKKKTRKKPLNKSQWIYFWEGLFLAQFLLGAYFLGGLFLYQTNNVVDYLFSADVEKQLADTELITTEQNSRLDEILQELTIIKVSVPLQQRRVTK